MAQRMMEKHWHQTASITIEWRKLTRGGGKGNLSPKWGFRLRAVFVLKQRLKLQLKERSHSFWKHQPL